MQNFRNRMGWALSGALALVLIATLARAIQAGPLDPPGPVGSTMKTIGDLVPSWHQTLNSNGCGSARWSCVMGGAAVLDNETGLVWERTPTTTAGESWFAAQDSCQSASTGSRLGWRLPAVEELLTLRDLSTVDGLPTGHPFSGVSVGGFWSTSSAVNDERYARGVTFPAEFGAPQALPKDVATRGAWCVRGGHGENAQTPSDLTAWSKKLSALSLDSCHTRRFTCVLNGDQGVLDHETGLVWTRGATDFGAFDLQSGVSGCYGINVGGVSGWRLPTEAELLSLLDTTVVNPAFSVPIGNPFAGVSAYAFPWLSSQSAGSGSSYGVQFKGPGAGQPGSYVILPTTGTWSVWCVRGAVTQ